MVKLVRKLGIAWGKAESEDGSETIYLGPKVLRLEDLYFCLFWDARSLSYWAYICESCWCNCIEVLATICSPLGRPGSSRRQWSGYVQHITAADVLTEKKLPFQIFPTAANKIQMLDWSCFCLPPTSFSPSTPSSALLHLFSALLVLPHSSTMLIIYFTVSSTFHPISLSFTPPPPSSPCHPSILAASFLSSH